MKTTIIACVMALCAAFIPADAGAQKTEKQKEIIDLVHRTNDYFMQKYNDPTKDTFVKKLRTSNLWTRAVYYEGLMALYDIDPQQRYIDYTDRWADYHKWTARGSVNDMDADNQCCQQTYIDRHVQSGMKKDMSKVKENLDHQMATGKYSYWTWSPFWTNHLYNSDHVRYLDCYIYSPTMGLKAPSSDAIDIDVCHDVIIDGCYMSVNDDAVAIKGGKGTWADKAPENGPNFNILIQNCKYGVVHGCLTLGSESVYDRNIVLRNIEVDNANRVLWLKMRPDTPQHYEYVTVDNISGTTGSFLVVRPWTQFFNPEDRADMPKSQCNNIVMTNIHMECRNFFDVGTSDKYLLRDFTFKNINVKDEKKAFDKTMIENTIVENVTIL